MVQTSVFFLCSMVFKDVFKEANKLNMGMVLHVFYVKLTRMWHTTRAPVSRQTIPIDSDYADIL